MPQGIESPLERGVVEFVTRSVSVEWSAMSNRSSGAAETAFAPHLVLSVRLIEAATALTGVHRNAAAVLCDREHASQRSPGIVGFARSCHRGVAP
jgi:hypothetical protein